MRVTLEPSPMHDHRTSLPLGALALLSLGAPLAAQDTADVYTQRLEVHGVQILATAEVAPPYLEIAARTYDHMTGRAEPYDLRALHRASGFRILLIHPEGSFLDLPEYSNAEPELDQAGGLGGCIGEFFISLRVGSPHTLVHELGHGIYHSAIQYQETGGADDEEAWYRERLKAVHGVTPEELGPRLGRGEFHEVLLAPAGTFSADLAAAWRRAELGGLWRDDYAGSEPNEYWAEGVALWFRAWQPTEADPRELLRARDPGLAELCARIFPDDDWRPADALPAQAAGIPYEDEQVGLGGDAAEGGLHELFELLDRDRDGRVDAHEGAEAWLFLTEEADANGDGALAGEELLDHLREAREEERAEREETFGEFDADGDGLLTSAELPEELHGVLEVVDEDGDGSLSLAELLATDALDDPRLFFEQELLSFLEEVDEDGDGAFALDDLPLFERAAFAEDFERLDRDRDGLVDREELVVLLDDELASAEFTVEGPDALMRGVIGPSTPGCVLALLLEHPEVERIVMVEVPGSMDDDSNLRAARMVRRAGLDTHVPADGEVASGGTDFFQAGVRRTKDEGARFGVHSWSGLDEEGADLPRDDPEHRKYLAYCRDMGIPEDFYWFTLEAAPAEDVHWMTEEELERFGMLTSGAGAAAPREPEELLGGCVLREPRAAAPAEPGRVGPVEDSTEYGPLNRRLVACGITLAAEPGVPDAFLERVGAVVAEIFREGQGIDQGLQRAVQSHLHAYRALLPVPRDEESLERLIEGAPEAFEQVQRENSLCDIIMAEVPEGQVMEVVEHLLHAITDVGLHYQFPAEWGLSRESLLWRAMQEAIERGHYRVESYGDLRREAPAEVYERILLQEFAYWFVSTVWDLQRPYGPDEAEWTLRTPAELQQHYPELMEAYRRTAGLVLSAPSPESLARIGPTRAEERRR